MYMSVMWNAERLAFILPVGDQPVYGHIVHVSLEHLNDYVISYPFIDPCHMRKSFSCVT